MRVDARALETELLAGPLVKPEFAELYRDHCAFVWRCTRRLGVPPRDVPDVCQDVFVLAHGKYHSFDGRFPRAWLFAICRRVAADYRKRVTVRKADVSTLHEGQCEDPADVLARKQARAQLDRILDELDDDKRAVFVLFELEQLPMSEIAAAVGCPLQTAYSRLYAARRHVEEQVAMLASSYVEGESA